MDAAENLNGFDMVHISSPDRDDLVQQMGLMFNKIELNMSKHTWVEQIIAKPDSEVSAKSVAEEWLVEQKLPSPTNTNLSGGDRGRADAHVALWRRCGAVMWFSGAVAH